MTLLRSATAAFLLLASSSTARVLGSSDNANAKLSTRGGYGQCVSDSSQPDWYNRNLNTVRSIYDITVYPNNIPIILGGGKAVPPGLFTEQATGRVSPVGSFEGFQDSVEYFFALAPTPFTNNQSTAFYDSQVVEFVSGCPNVAASLVYFRTGSVDMTGKLDKSKPTSTLSQVAFWRFDDNGAVAYYHAWIPNLQAWTKASSGIDYGSMQVQAGAAQGLCPAIQQRCSGKDQQYSSVEDCAATLGSKPFGNFDEAWGDNIACRTIHMILTLVRPEVHCPHVGPTGGGKCIDIDYSTSYFDDETLFKGPLGSVFSCSGPLQPDNQVGAGPGAAQILQGLAKAAASGQLPGMPGMPGAGGAVGSAPGALPGMSGMPGAGGAMSSAAGAMPGAGGAMGSAAGAMPGAGGAMSSAAGATPGMHGTPGAGGAMGSAAGAMPGAGGAMGSAAGATPGMHGMPGAGGAMGSGAMPSGMGGQPGECPQSGTPANPAAQAAADAMNGHPMSGGACAANGMGQSGAPTNPAAQSAADAMAGGPHTGAGMAPHSQPFGMGSGPDGADGKSPVPGAKSYQAAPPPHYQKWKA